MCEPTSATLAYVAIASSVAAAGMSAYGMYQQGQQQKKMADYQSAIARNNAIRAEYMAQDALDRGKIAEQQQRLRGRLLLGQMRASLAGSGVDINEGSAVEMQVDQAGINALDALNVRNNAEREAQNYRIQASDFNSQSDMYSVAGRNAAANGTWGAASSVMAGVGNVAGKWYSFDRGGAFSSQGLGDYNGGFTRNPGGIDAQ